VSLIDVVKGLLGGADTETTQPSVADITIISTDAVKSPSGTPSATGQG